MEGAIRLRSLDSGDYLQDSYKVEVKGEVPCYGGVDRSGEFLCASIERVPPPEVTWKPAKAFYAVSDYEGYTCPITNQYVEGRAAHRENLKRHDVHVLEKGEKEHNERRRLEERERDNSRLASEITAEIAAKL